MLTQNIEQVAQTAFIHAARDEIAVRFGWPWGEQLRNETIAMRRASDARHADAVEALAARMLEMAEQLRARTYEFR